MLILRDILRFTWKSYTLGRFSQGWNFSCFKMYRGMLGKHFLGHQFKSGHFQCKTQIRQYNCVGAPRKGPKPHPS